MSRLATTQTHKHLLTIICAAATLLSTQACSPHNSSSEATSDADYASDTGSDVQTSDAFATPDLPLPFEVPAECQTVAPVMASAETCATIRPERLPERSHLSIWKRGETFVAFDNQAPGFTGELVTLEGVAESIADVGAVWGCDSEWWASGNEGRILRHVGDERESYQLPEDSSLTAGLGCEDDAIVAGLGQGIWRRSRADGAWEKWADTAVKVYPGVEPSDTPIQEITRILRNGPWTVALRNYGHSYVHNAQTGGGWRYRGRTDDINSDVFIRADGRGFTLHGGYGLYLDLNLANGEEPNLTIPHTAHEVVRVTDTIYWLIANSEIRRIDGASCSLYSVPKTDYELLSIAHATRDEQWLWLSTLLRDSGQGGEPARSAPTLHAFHPDHGWCVFSNES